MPGMMEALLDKECAVNKTNNENKRSGDDTRASKAHVLLHLRLGRHGKLSNDGTVNPLRFDTRT